MSRVENPGWKLGLVQRFVDHGQPSASVSHVQVHDSGLPGEHAADMYLAGHTEQLVQSGLAGAVIAQGDFACADDRVHVNQIAPDGSRQRDQRQVITPGHAVAIQPVFVKLPGGCNEFGDSPGILSDLWWTWTAPATGIASFNTCGGGLDTKMAVYLDACPVAEGTEIGCSDDGDCPVGVAGGGGESDVAIFVAAGSTYLIRVGGWGTDGGGQGPTGTGVLNVESFAAAFGACCMGDGSCSIETEPICGVIGGTYSGDSTVCSPNDCPPPPVCPGDCGVGDGAVDILDLLELLSQWSGGGSCDIAPIGGDGIVDILDLLDLLGGWGLCG